jgi:hypothetical protein
MDYAIRRNPRELDSTGYMEIGPGRYAGKHWQDGFVFVWEDAFAVAEWRAASEALATLSVAEASGVLNLEACYRNGLEEEIGTRRGEIRTLLLKLADECERFSQEADWVCVLGM